LSKVLSFDQFLLENVDQTIEKLEDIVANKIVCSVDYKGEDPNDPLRGIRFIEPYTVGISEKGQTYLRAWLIKGVSKTGRKNPRLVPGWRLFRVDRIKAINPTLQKFTVPKKGYNDQDSAMEEILFTASF
jgi:predicted DNA-binding transcriptional regulator YafY